MSPRTLVVADARRWRDGHEFLTFNCWSGDPDEHYAAEAEGFIRKLALKTTFKSLAFREEDGTLAGVSSFDKAAVQPFEAANYVEHGWQLQVVGVRRDLQGPTVNSDIAGCPPELPISDYVFRKTYERMLELDPTRVIVRARIHDDNRRSIAACSRVGLERTVRESQDYWRMLGAADPTVNCSP
jgi:hypothetical protein